MSEVDFGENNKNIYYNFQNNSESKGMVGLLIKWKIVDNEKNAQILLFFIAVICFAISAYIAFAFLVPPRVVSDQNYDYINGPAINPDININN